jgi:hypothetical protein
MQLTVILTESAVPATCPGRRCRVFRTAEEGFPAGSRDQQRTKMVTREETWL